MAEGMRRMGFGDADIARARSERAGGAAAAGEPDDFEVHEDCWESWQFFLQVQRLWVFLPVRAGFGMSAVRWCLDWTMVRSVVMLSRLPPKRWESLTDDLMTIERAVLRAEADQKKGN